MLRFLTIGYESLRGLLPVMFAIARLSTRFSWRLVIACVFNGLSTLLAADTLDNDIEALKADVAELSQSLFELEEQVLHPADSQVAVYLSMADRDAIILDSVELSINGRPTMSHIYTDQEREALSQGGVQRLYIGNLATGEHQLGATLNGQASNDRYVRREASFDIRKAEGETRLQLVLQAPAPDFQPKFTLKEWQ